MARALLLAALIGLMAFAAAPAANANAYCEVCVEVAEQIVEKGADAACDAVGLEPPLSELCGWIASHAAEELLKLLGNGYSYETACKQIGLCPHLGNCDCGECASASSGRCLSLPNKCPRAGNPLLSVAKQAEFMQQNLRAESGFCVDGSCDSGHVGCCLTCF
mmetsp:Transcript_688/g.2032  ORF Transcript_688/g.2032 Transcript_688/m.2032 type:complete len:163 (-) Transcript_688:99-587(-)|eukprot:CAMPEP_0203809316 /NCGR_PEP_ID=MMETSP0115-20131106/2204_1 /ASSEMBLY_ACC=CAM_ASM_000227 /TAXON_ID=33651 /ORGANISM="Bicosoecid sp, Strain ms1" /LENGTH=162 /DNA_ID=CAMNT_0050718041 /DNA_START=33 /DNA_END=521 /DNA_ORIENTATION=+